MRNEKDINQEYHRELRDVRNLRKEIRANETGEYGNEARKNDLLRDLDRKWTSRVDEYRMEAMEARQEAVKQAKKRAFRLTGVDARNALQMANSIDKDSLEKEYRKADERSDNTLKHAIAYRGFNEGRGDLVDKWADETPTNRQEIDDLREASQRASDTTSLQNEYTSYGPVKSGGDEEWLDA